MTPGLDRRRCRQEEKVDFNELEYVLLIAQEKNISRAAKRLFITQPALSRSLHRIEDELGAELFVRKNRQYEPTYIGEQFLDMARTVLSAKQSFEDKLNRFKNAKSGEISMGVTPGRGRTLLPKILPLFRKAFPDYRLKLCEEDVETLEQYLRDGTIELAIFTAVDEGDYKRNEFQYSSLAKEEIVVCTAKDERYSILAQHIPNRDNPWIDLTLLRNESFLLLKENLRLGHYAGELLISFGINAQITRFGSINTILALVAEGYGIAFANRKRVEKHADADRISAYSFGKEPVFWDVVAVCRKDYQIEGAVEQLIRLIATASQE